MKKVVILSGAGISAESGIKTFRDSCDGLWDNYNISDVCTAEAWAKNPTMVNDFYNIRRIEVMNALPNKAHHDLVKLERLFEVQIITQNIDDLHERAGSTNILHLHGEILKARSSNEKYDWMGISKDEKINNPKLYDVGRKGLNCYNDYAEDGFPLRPFVVFFGENVPKISEAIEIVKTADYLIVVGTSLSVFPASSLVYSTKNDCITYVIDPNGNENDFDSTYTILVKENATIGIESAINDIILNCDN